MLASECIDARVLTELISAVPRNIHVTYKFGEVGKFR